MCNESNGETPSPDNKSIDPKDLLARFRTSALGSIPLKYDLILWENLAPPSWQSEAINGGGVVLPRKLCGPAFLRLAGDIVAWGIIEKRRKSYQFKLREFITEENRTVLFKKFNLDSHPHIIHK